MDNNKIFWLIGTLGAVIIGLFVVGVVLAKESSSSTKELHNIATNEPNQPVEELTSESIVPEVPAVAAMTHITTPNPVRALYMSSWVASTTTMRDKIINMIDTTEINAVVIDIKDATGRVSFLVNDKIVADTESPKDLIKDISGLIQTLHDKNIYVVGRISVFQDPYLTQKKPEWALKNKSNGTIWKDKKGLSFLDPTKQEVWDYVMHLALESYAKGFDEINFDYIRFPSDGNIKDIAYPTSIASKADAIRLFWEHLHQVMTVDSHIPTSADVFGLTTEAKDDMGIGQVLENALPNFDFIAPMIYPSHYPKGYQGFQNPASKPYEVVTIAMKSGVTRAKALGMGPEKFRPWIQDFDMGSTYTAAMIREQIKALHEQGIESYMVWDPANTYTVGAYTKE